MKKMGYAYWTAVDGQKAIEAYKLAEGSIKCVLMGTLISEPYGIYCLTNLIEP